MTSNDKQAAPAGIASQKSKLAAERKERLAAEMRANMKKRRAVSKSRDSAAPRRAPRSQGQSAADDSKSGD